MKVWQMSLEEDRRFFAVPESALDSVMEELRGLDIGEVTTIRVVEMSQEDYDKLPEFEGF